MNQNIEWTDFIQPNRRHFKIKHSLRGIFVLAMNILFIFTANSHGRKHIQKQLIQKTRKGKKAEKQIEVVVQF